MTFDIFNGLLVGIFMLLLISTVLLDIFKYPILKKCLYITISIACVLLATLRPPEIARDFISYQIHVENICAINECGLDQEVENDIGYFILLSISKLLFDDFQALLFLAGLALAIKLYLIARMTKYSMLSLYFYFSVFFLYHDVTQARTSVAIAFFLLALYLMDAERIKLGIAAYFAAATIHSQALIALLSQLANKIIGHKYWLAISLIVLSQLAVVAHLTPSTLMRNLILEMDISTHFARNLSYEDDGKMFDLKATNFLMILILAVTVFPLKRMITTHKLFDYCFGSVVVGYIFYWIFAGIPAVPHRLLQFYWVPLTILVSLGSTHKLTHVTTIFVGAAFFILTFFISPILET